MKLLIQTVTIIILTTLVELIFQWWGSLMIVCFLVCFFMYGTRSSSFFSGLLGVGLLWIAVALFIDISTSSILTEKIVRIFHLPVSGGRTLLILITGLIGGLAGGFSALSGHFLREIFSR
jgi:hypothetical protein